jgi:predicted nuclease with TOPRIM domain
VSTQADDTETQRLKAELEEALAERTRLWDELQRRNADAEEVAYLRSELARIEGSPSYRITAPLRKARALRLKARRRFAALKAEALNALGRGR